MKTKISGVDVEVKLKKIKGEGEIHILVNDYYVAYITKNGYMDFAEGVCRTDTGLALDEYGKIMIRED